MKEDLAHVDARRATIALNCLSRLRKRYWALALKGKLRPVALTAIATEFAGFIWAMMQPQAAAA